MKVKDKDQIVKKENAINLVYFILFLDHLAVSMSITFLSRYSRSLGASPSSIGFIGSVYGILQFFSSPMIGRFADQYGRRYILFRCLLFSATGYYILGCSTTLTMVILSRILPGCFKQVANILTSYIPYIAEKEKLSQVYSRLFALSNAAFILGPGIGGYIIDFNGGFNISAIICASIFVVNSVLVKLFLPEATEKQDTEGGDGPQTKPSMISALKQVFKSKVMAHIFLVQILISTSSLIHRENSTLLLDYRFKPSGKVVGFIMSFSAVVATLSAFFVERITDMTVYKNNPSKIVLHMTILHVLSLLGTSFSFDILLYTFFLMPYKIAQQVMRVSVTNWKVESLPSKEDSGILFGVSQSVNSVGRLAAPLICGFIQEYSVTWAEIFSLLIAVPAIFLLCNTSIYGKRDIDKKIK